MGSTPSAPAVPDPYKTASAQAQANASTATANAYVNNPNVNNPYGSSTTTQTGSYSTTNPDGTTSTYPTFTVNQTLNATQQGLLDQQNALSGQYNDIAQTAMNTVGNTLANPLTADQFGQTQTGVGSSPTLQNSYASGQLQTSYNPGGAIQTSYDTGPALQYGYDSGGAIQRLSGPTLQGTNAPSTFGNTSSSIQNDVNLNANSPTTFGQTQNGVQYFQGGDFSGERDAATNAALARLAPSMAAQSESLNSSLANQGTAQGSAAWNAAQLSQNQAQNDLRLGAVATGDAEQQALFGEAATKNQLYNAAQQQDYSQQQGRGQFAQAGIAANNAATLAQGQFHNAAQSQDFDQLNARAAYAQNAYGMDNAAIGANNTAALNYGAFNNSAQAQQNSQNAAAAGFYNSTVGQQNQQNAAAASFYDTAQGQQNAQNANAAGFYNSAIGNQAQMSQALAAFSNQAGNQDYQNRLSAGAFNNSAVQQQYQLAMALQNQQINQISALRSGGQVTAPQFSAYQPSQVDQTPISANVYQSAGLEEQQYQAQLQNSAANTAALGSAFGGLASMFKFTPSDRRLKSNIERIGATSHGLPVYSYDLVGTSGRQVGCMADEVALIHPDAVATHPDGYGMVDYSRIAA